MLLEHSYSLTSKEFVFNLCLIYYMFRGYVQKKMKDSSAPKRPMSAYMLWLNSSRDRIKAENPGISVTEILKKAGEMWKQLSKEKKEVIDTLFPLLLLFSCCMPKMFDLSFIFWNHGQGLHMVLKVLEYLEKPWLLCESA